MSQDAAAGYRIELPGLAAAVARCTPDAKHRQLIEALRRFEPLAHAQLAAVWSDAWLGRRKVLDAQGALVSDNHEAWLEEQLVLDGGRADRTHERLKDAGYLLSLCGITTLYLVHDRGSSDPASFVQIEVDVEDEWTDRALFGDWCYRTPRDLWDLLNAPGDELPAGYAGMRHPSNGRGCSPTGCSRAPGAAARGCVSTGS